MVKSNPLDSEVVGLNFPQVQNTDIVLYINNSWASFQSTKILWKNYEAIDGVVKWYTAMMTKTFNCVQSIIMSISQYVV